jgi:hypothetical protein
MKLSIALRIVVIALFSDGCWYMADEEHHGHMRPGTLGLKISSRLTEDELSRIRAFEAEGNFDAIQAFFVARAAHYDAQKGSFSQFEADFSRLDVEHARDEAKARRDLEPELRRYRDACGIPEPLPLPQYCR